ncbi:hypothetical protein FHT72_006324 [Rhizobium sp. BK077]|uniref:hypothetical protein n=1 Tax=unclassified Rhizobium TaxID=2613769 RepID=UPI00161423C9|nr:MULTISPECIES: hypothetical protein [unclassified Rhizobium]MBB3302819.1 hypothetical protein [Rhizobium sp. BK112]MBB3371792.1 hypothetical protein [Rhizobium sp. BK077]MBB4182563.1 hypothetical protein [Rhizobium sp. BK109]
MKKFLKFEFTKWAMRGEASGRLETWLLFTMFMIARLAPLVVASGVGLHYLQGAPAVDQLPSELFWQA